MTSVLGGSAPGDHDCVSERDTANPRIIQTLSHAENGHVHHPTTSDNRAARGQSRCRVCLPGSSAIRPGRDHAAETSLSCAHHHAVVERECRPCDRLE
jgi:hypothetical protein